MATLLRTTRRRPWGNPCVNAHRARARPTRALPIVRRVAAEQPLAERPSWVGLAFGEQEVDPAFDGALDLVADCTGRLVVVLATLEAGGVDRLAEPEVQALGVRQGGIGRAAGRGRG